ncbi:MAG: OmpA family protein [Gammaproteobacteria bacterium]|nr:OmpA family protein [Gammaproteobacteria bacterium]
MQTSHVAVLAAIAFAVISWFNLDTGAGSIQSDLRARAQQEISAVLEDTDEIQIEADGRDLILTGTVSSESLRAEAQSRVSGLWGVRAVNNLVEVAETVEPAPSSFPLMAVPYELVVSLTSAGTVLDGLVRDEATRAALLTIAAGRAVDGGVRDMLEVEPDTRPHWSAATQEIMQAIVALQEVEARFVDQEISIKGRARSPEERNRALAAIRSAVPYGVILQTDLTVPLSTAAERCEQRFAELQAHRPVVFLPTSTALLPGSRELLDALAVTLEQCGDTRIEVAGYSESTRDYGTALRVSQARAEAIEEQLIARGVDGNRLSAIGYGMSESDRSESVVDARMSTRQMALIVRGH